MMKIKLLIIFTVCLMGCRALSKDGQVLNPKTTPLLEAQERLEEGEYHQARKIVEKWLKSNPKDEEAKKLMAKIIDQEIAQYKEAFETNAPEELNKDQKSSEARTWLERSRTLLEIKQYDEAALAAEKVFVYDPNNKEASGLMDEIKTKALKEGKQEILIRNQIYRDEIKDRLGEYHKQVKEWVQEEKWGAARLTADKILLLAPEDQEALEVKEAIRKHNTSLRKKEQAAQQEASQKRESALAEAA